MFRPNGYLIKLLIVSACVWLTPGLVHAAGLDLSGQEKEPRVISIQVERHPEVSGDYLVDESGRIKYEFVGDILVQQKSAAEIKADVHRRLSEYIIDPKVQVSFADMQFVYVAGEVARPGKTYVDDASLHVRDVLIKAELPLLSADLEKAYILRLISEDKRERVRVDLKKLLIKGDLRENKRMIPGDILYVPARKIEAPSQISLESIMGDGLEGSSPKL